MAQWLRLDGCERMASSGAPAMPFRQAHDWVVLLDNAPDMALEWLYLDEQWRLSSLTPPPWAGLTLSLPLSLCQEAGLTPLTYILHLSKPIHRRHYAPEWLGSRL